MPHEITDPKEEEEASNMDDEIEESKPDVPSFPDYLSGIQSAISYLARAASSYTLQLSSFVSSFEPIRKAAQNYINLLNQFDFNALADTLAAVQRSINSYVIGLQIPSVSEERRQELLASYRAWGEYGWTLNPNESFLKLFKNPPVDKKDADKTALQGCKDTELLFQDLCEHRRAKKSDLGEAIADFKDRRYKSCALVLFALIDAQLIRFQRKKETKGNRRGVGSRAVKRAIERVGIDEQTDGLFSALYYANLFSCLGKVFEDGNDFKQQPEVINRNFLDHGMLTRPVRKKDCLQLFLLYYNVLEMLDMEYDIG